MNIKTISQHTRAFISVLRYRKTKVKRKFSHINGATRKYHARQQLWKWVKVLAKTVVKQTKYTQRSDKL